MLRFTLAALAALIGLTAGCAKQCYDCGGRMVNPDAAKQEAEQLCARAKTLQQEACAPFDQVDPALLANCTVVDSLYIADIDGCMRKPTCDAFHECVGKVQVNGGTYDGPTRSCNDITRESIPAGFSGADLERSTGFKDKKFSDTVSTKELPIEVCGMPDQLAYLTRVTCNDGSKPFATRAAADGSRVGNVGRGGRCQRVIDEYAVPCPEKTYQVFIDAYRCLLR